MNCLTLVLSILFRLKHHEMNHLPRNLSANIFDRTFSVFNPYSERRKVIHNFLFIAHILPLITVFVSWYLAPLALFKVLESGLLLSVVLLIIWLNLMLIEVASEIYQNAKTFINAFNNKADLGAGDLKVFQVLKTALPKLSNYHLALSILFLTLAATLGYIWSSLLWFFARVIGLILEFQGSIGGTIAFPVSVLLFSLMVGIVQIFIWKIKSKVLSHLLGA